MAAKMVFGEKAKNLKSMRKDMQKRKERGGGLSFIGENGLNVRFLLEPEAAAAAKERLASLK